MPSILYVALKSAPLDRRTRALERSCQDIAELGAMLSAVEGEVQTARALALSVARIFLKSEHTPTGRPMYGCHLVFHFESMLKASYSVKTSIELPEYI